MQGFLDGTREGYETIVNKLRQIDVETRVVFNDQEKGTESRLKPLQFHISLYGQ